MSNILDTVNQRTQLVGQNRLELLLFRLHGLQTYGINVFKVREVIRCPELTIIPKSDRVVRGLAHIRGHTLSIIDLSLAVGGQAVQNPEEAFIIITEYNQSVQGFLVDKVERIVNMHWEQIKAPPAGLSQQGTYLTAVTEIDGKLVEILDVEKILQDISPLPTDIGDRPTDVATVNNLKTKKVLIVDDSSVARNQVSKLLSQLGIVVETKNNGREAWEHLKALSQAGKNIVDEYCLMISDIEMPEMDGYTLTSHIKADQNLKPLYVILHTSLSGVFNSALVEKVGADKFVAKFKAESLAEVVMEHINALAGKAA